MTRGWQCCWRSARLSVRAEIGLEADLMQGLVEVRLDIGVMYTPESRPGLKVDPLFDDVLSSLPPTRRGRRNRGRAMSMSIGGRILARHSASFPEFLRLGAHGEHRLARPAACAREWRLGLFSDPPRAAVSAKRQTGVDLADRSSCCPPTLSIPSTPGATQSRLRLRVIREAAALEGVSTTKIQLTRLRVLRGMHGVEQQGPAIIGPDLALAYHAELFQRALSRDVSPGA